MSDTGKLPEPAGFTLTARYDTIRTKRLIMRRWRESDYEPFAALNADPETMRYLPSTLSRAESIRAIVWMDDLQIEPFGFGLWALEVIESGEFIGLTGLNPMPPEGVPGAGGMEVGWRLMRGAWHYGYATEAGMAALDVAFNGLGLDVVYSMTSVLNLPSQAVMRRLGLTEFARFDSPSFPRGNPNRPHIWYRRTRPGV
jgi:RimJ/RimL family protein N-acetyltransferase